jgi:hypothetical protein
MRRQEQNWFRYRSTVSRVEIDEPVVTIPVVVHIVFNSSQQNIQDSQVISQLQVLNNDYRQKNVDVSRVPDVWKDIVGDCRMEFKLAQTDPIGNPTNGITRTETTVVQFTHGADANGNPLPESIKFTDQGGKDAWDTTRYLNIWVCDIREEDPNFGSGQLLGYAQFPDAEPSTDGVVIYYRAFGVGGSAQSPFHLGRTTTHEVGHWMGLRHVWGHDRFNACDGTDNIPDTPNQAGPNRDVPTFPSTTQSCPDTGPNGTMYVNFMDYSNDEITVCFTLGQAAKMRSVLATSRPTLLTTQVVKSPKDEAKLLKLRTLPPKVFDGADSMVEVNQLL